MASDHVSDVTADTFDAEVLGADVPVLVDFWATWCAPCKAIAPHLETLAAEMGDKVKIVKVDAQTNKGVATANRVRNLPTFVLFNGGKEVSRKVGTAGGISAIRDLVEAAL